MSTLNNMLKRLTDAYSRNPESNVGKLLGIAAGELEDLQEALQKTRLYRDIDQAEGITLNSIGFNVQQYRGQATDEVYRILIKSKISRNLSDGSINAIIRVLAVILDTTTSGIQIRELWGDCEGEPAAVWISVPSRSLNKAGFSLNQFGRLVNRIVAAGVRASVLFEGTFQFSSQNNASETDNDAGFACTEQEIGGSMGSVYDIGNNPDLPL